MNVYPDFEPHFPRNQWTLPAVLTHQAAVRGGAPFLQWGHDEPPLSFAQTNEQANRLANGLARLGLQRGDTAVLLLPNCIEFVLTWFALAKLGVVEAPINTAYRGAFLEHQVNTCEASTIVVDESLLSVVLESLSAMPKVRRLVVRGAGAPAVEGVEVVRLDALFSDDPADPGAVVRPMDIAAILFTSGTTGLSKGVMMRHAQMYFFAELTAELTHLTADDTYMTGFPLFHGNAHFMTVYPALLMGARCVLYDRFSASEWVTRLAKSGATVTNSIGVTMPFVYAQPPSPLDRGHRLRCAFTAPTPFDILEDFRERFGVQEFPEGFGLTETCMCLMSPRGMARPRGACGLAVSQYFDVRLVDPETDEDVALGEVGELVVRPKLPGLVTAGYVNMPDKTAEAMRNLWFHTGDGMRQDADGWFYFVDRMKDALRRRGENISSFELEATIREHPDIADVAVIAAPSDVEGGEDEIMACLIAEEGVELDFVALTGWCEGRLPYFAVPRFFEQMDAFPKTPTERVQKKILRERGIGGAWDRVKADIKLRDETARDAKRKSRPA